MNYLIFFTLLNFLLSFDYNQTYVISEKRVSVKGKTSLGGFTCRYSEKDLNESLVMNARNELPDLDLKIIVKDFGCGNFVLNKDFRKTIKAEEYPVATVKVTHWKKTQGKNYCNMFVTLAGKDLEFKNLELVPAKGGVKANVDIQFSELGLSPPSKMGGLVKVDEELKLEIFLAFQIR
jgi:hypothetical protein